MGLRLTIRWDGRRPRLWLRKMSNSKNAFPYYFVVPTATSQRVVKEFDDGVRNMKARKAS